jgi:hypothetical protein
LSRIGEVKPFEILDELVSRTPFSCRVGQPSRLALVAPSLKRCKVRRLTYVGQPSRLALDGASLKRCKAGRLTYVGQPSRLALSAPSLKRR